MFRILCKSLHSFGSRTTSKPHKLFIIGLQECSYSSTTANKSISECVNQDSFTVGYLMTKFGFSLEKAVFGSKKLFFKDCSKPDAVVSFLKNQGFDQTQVCKVISAASFILDCSPEDTLLPKIEFFRSKGVEKTDLAKMVVLNVRLLTRSLDNVILPSYEFLRDLVGSDEGAIRMLKTDSRLLDLVENRVKPNIEILRGAGVPRSRIAYILKHQPSMFAMASDNLKESIEEVRKMGMDPESCPHIVAVSLLTIIPRSKWNEKLEAYKRWGCSKDEVITRFKIIPRIMSLSVEKIDGVMSFCVSELGCEPSEVMRKYYVLLTFSLNKKIIPRWAVYRELVSKRLVKGKDGKFKTMFHMKEDLFLEKYVNCYKNEAPMLLKLYQEKLKASN